MTNNRLEPNTEPAGSWVFDTKQCCEYPAMIDWVLGIQFTKAEYIAIYEYLASLKLGIQLHILWRITNSQLARYLIMAGYSQHCLVSNTQLPDGSMLGSNRLFVILYFEFPIPS